MEIVNIDETCSVRPRLLESARLHETGTGLDHTSLRTGAARAG